ncbi:unnamed protein product [Arabis nemorensis]|uniref:Pentatricopeptide repeat-containing protein n=1 Tax=Arabis nemorensis TaxID=586526 RepID=A0A565AZ03_9BRAS|nr:unnamed protein product [Arabis nemorensis]
MEEENSKVRPKEITLLVVLNACSHGGLLEESFKLISNLPVTSDSTAWRALLAACRVYGNAELGEIVMMRYIRLLAGTHAVAGNSQGQQKSLDNELFKEKKEAGYSAIEIE